MTDKYPTALELLNKEANKLNSEAKQLEDLYEHSKDTEYRKVIRSQQKKLQTKINRVQEELLNQDKLTP